MRHSSEDFAIADLVDDWNRRWVDPALLARLAELEAEKAKLARKCVIFQTLMENIMGTAIIETEEHGDQTAGAALAAIRGSIYDTYHELQEVDR